MANTLMNYGTVSPSLWFEINRGGHLLPGSYVYIGKRHIYLCPEVDMNKGKLKQYA